MKKIITWILLAAMLLGMFAGCGKSEDPTQPSTAPVETTEAPAGENNAAEVTAYLQAIYKDSGAKTSGNFERFGIVRIAGVPYEVVWTADVSEDLVKIIVNDDGTVTIDVNENCTEDTVYVLTATVTDANGNTSTASWEYLLPGVASVEEMQAIVDQAYALENGEALAEEVTLKGVIKSIDTPWSEQYQNITVTIQVEGREDKPIQCYRLKGEGAKDLVPGDTISVQGIIKNYNGTIEFDAGSTLVTVEKTGTPIEIPSDPHEILNDVYALGDNEALPYGPVTLTGRICAIDEAYSEEYGNITVSILIDWYTIKCYRMSGEGVEDLEMNDIITVQGYIKKYNGTREFDKPTLLDVVKVGAYPQPSDPVEVVEAAYNLDPGWTLPYSPVTLTGTITKSGTWSDQYENVTVTFVVDGAEDMPIECYRMTYGEDAPKAIKEAIKTLAKGDKITVKGMLIKYQNTKSGATKVEFNVPELISVTKGEKEESNLIGTLATELKNGDKVVIVAPTQKIALSSEMNGYYPKGVAVTIEGNMVTGFFATEVMTVTVNSDGTYSFGYGGQNLGMSDSYSSMPFGNPHDDWTLIPLSGGVYNVQNTVRGNYMQYATSYSTWQTSSSVQSDGSCNLSFYKVEGDIVSSDPAAGSTLTVSEAIALGASKDHDEYTSGKYYVTGVITEIYNTTYGNMRIKDDSGNILTIYGTYDSTGANRFDAMPTKPVVGDTVKLYGIIGQYNGTAQMKNGWIMQIGTGGTTPDPEPPVSSDPAADSELTIPEAIALGTSKAHNVYTSGKYYVTGIVTEIYNTTYGNMYIKDEAGNILTIYGTYDSTGANRFDAMTTKPVVGDTVKLYGIIGQYNGTAQMKNGWLMQIGTGGTTPDPEPDTPVTPPATGNGDYVKVTGADQFTTGKYVMVVSTGYAPTTLSGSWILAGKPTVAGDTITADNAAGYIWDITVSGTSATLTDANGAAIAPKAGNNNGIQSGGYSWAWAFSGGAFTFAGTGSDTTILASNNGSSGQFRAYKTSTVSGNASGYPSTFTLYKLTEASSEVTINKISEALAASSGEFTVKGVVTLLDSSNVYVQDSTGGICVRMSSAPTDLAVGDTIIGTGSKATYQGLPQLGSGTYEKSSGGTLSAKETTIGALTTADLCTYITLKDVTVTEVYDNNGAYSSPNITVEDEAGNTIQIYKAVVGKTGGAWDVKVGNVLTVSGAVGCYNSTLQLRNTNASEIVVTSQGDAEEDGDGDDNTGSETPGDTTTVTVSLSDYASANSWANGTMYNTLVMNDDITVTATGGQNTGKYYTSGTNWRIYQNESPAVTIAAANGKTIVSVKITYASQNTGVLTLNGSNVSSGTAVTVNASSVTFSVGNTGTAANGQARITSIEVVYQ